MADSRELGSRVRADEDALRLGRALKNLRERLGVTQERASCCAEPAMTAQYWGMHETGRAPGIHKPKVQRKLLHALSVAAGLDVSLNPEDLAPEPPVSNPAQARARPGAEPDGADEAIFPTRDGDVVLRYPRQMTPEGLKDLEAYLAVFLTSRGRN